MFQTTRVIKFQTTLCVGNKRYFNFQGNPYLLFKIRIILSSNKIQLLQKQQFRNDFVKNLRKTTEFEFLYFTCSLKKIRRICTPLPL